MPNIDVNKQCLRVELSVVDRSVVRRQWLRRLTASVNAGAGGRFENLM